jgi:hypothetical protein
MPSRRQKKPTEALDRVQIIDFSSTEDTIQCEVPIDPLLLIQPELLPESLPQPATPSQPEAQDRFE